MGLILKPEPGPIPK